MINKSIELTSYSTIYGFTSTNPESNLESEICGILNIACQCIPNISNITYINYSLFKLCKGVDFRVSDHQNHCEYKYIYEFCGCLYAFYFDIYEDEKYVSRMTIYADGDVIEKTTYNEAYRKMTKDSLISYIISRLGCDEKRAIELKKKAMKLSSSSLRELVDSVYRCESVSSCELLVDMSLRKRG